MQYNRIPLGPLPDEHTAAFEVRRMLAQDVAAVAQLHFDLFGTGDSHGYSVAKLGREFLKHVFYKLNLSNPYFFCDVARYGDTVIGFSVYTTKRQSVFRYFLRHQPIRVLGNLIQLIGRNPRTLVAMVSNFRYLLSEELPWEGEVSGWWLVAGVRLEYRTREFEGRTGIHVAAQLFDQMEEVMQRDGCPAWYGVVRPDNTAINLFLQRRGAQLVANAQAQGMEMSYYVKILRS